MIALTDQSTPRLAAKVRLKWDEVRQKPLLLYPEGVLVLNPAAHEILGLCDGRRTIADIVQTLVEKYHSDKIGADVNELLTKLMAKGFVAVAD
jgi:pyrroloquinoline quinone biosynthesis protein D